MSEHVSKKQDNEEHRNGEQGCSSPWRCPLSLCRLRDFAPRPNQLDVERSLFTLWSDFDFERDALTLLRALTQTSERFDMDEDLLSPLSGLDEAEASIIVPGLDDAVELHDSDLPHRFNVGTLDLQVLEAHSRR